MELRKLSEDPVKKTITLTWDPVPGAEGYLFYLNGQRVSKTFDPAKRTIKFSTPGVYRVQAVVFSVLDQDTYPDPPKPPDPPAYVRVAPRVAYKEGGSDARYCTVNQPGVVRGSDGHAIDERGATYDPDGLCKNGLRSNGSDKDCPTGALGIDGREYCSLPTMGDPTKNTGSWLV